MIQVIYYRSYNRVTVTGHANSAEHGQDLVCCAASTLVYTLAVNVAKMAEFGQVREPVMKTSEGDAEISCNPKHNLKHVVTLVFDSLCAGFDLLATRYPEYVSYEIRP